jgi:hypothetical protein
MHDQRRSGRASAGEKRPLSSAPTTALQTPAPKHLSGRRLSTLSFEGLRPCGVTLHHAFIANDYSPKLKAAAPRGDVGPPLSNRLGRR